MLIPDNSLSGAKHFDRRDGHRFQWRERERERVWDRAGGNKTAYRGEWC